MNFLYITLGIVIGFLSYFVGVNIDKKWNIFYDISTLKNGVNDEVLFIFIMLISSLLTYMAFNYDVEKFVALPFILLMLSVSVSDIKERIVPDRIIVIGLIYFLIIRIIFQTSPWYDAYLGGILAFGLFYLIAYIGDRFYNQEVIGGGDIKLYALIGLVLGVELTFLSIFFASLIGWIFGNIMKRFSNEIYLPFVPFICIGVFISYFYGNLLLDWYFGLF